MSLLTNLVGYYKLDGNSNDSLGLHNGSSTSIVYSTANGKINQGAGFAGNPSKITGLPIPNTGAGAWTISYWLKTTATLNQNTCSFGNFDDRQAYEPLVTSGGKTSGNFYFGAGAVTSTTSTNTGAWFFVVFTFDGSLVKLYINAGLESTSSAVTGANMTANTQQLGNGATGFFSGDLDEVGLWSRALSSTEITQLYNGGAGIQYPFTTGGGAFLMFM